MKKVFLKLVLIVSLIGLLGAACYFTLVKMNFLPNPFEAKKAYILETPAIVKEIKSIAELYSVCYFDQIIVESVRKEVKTVDIILNFFGSKSTTDRKLVLVASAKVFAGYNLSKLDSTAIVLTDSILTIKLPAPQIIDIVMNPTDVTTFIEEGQWSLEEVKQVKNKAIEMFRKRSFSKGILDDAEKKGKETIELFFKSLGFKQVVIDNKLN